MSTANLPFERQRELIQRSLPHDRSLTIDVNIEDKCPMAVADHDGELGPCDRPVSTWALSLDPEFPFSLTTVCKRHRNALGAALGGRLAQELQWSWM